MPRSFPAASLLSVRDAVDDLAQGSGHPHRVVGLPDVAAEDQPLGATLYDPPGGLHDGPFATPRAAQGE